MAASFGLNASVAAAAAVAAFNNNSGVGGNVLVNNLLLASFAHSQQSNASGLTTTTVSTASSTSCNYPTDKIEWMSRIENAHVDRALMNRLVMNYLVTEGFKEAAEKFRNETGIYYQYDVDSLKERIKIRESIECGKITEAIHLINSLHPELIDNNRLIAFRLQQQHLIELIRERRLEEALMFAQNHLCEYGEISCQVQEELERTMALLAFDNPNESPFSDLLHPMQRQRLASEINSAILEYENIEPNAKLNVLIKMLLWSQDILDKRSVVYPKMTDIGNSRIEDSVANVSLSN